GRRLASCRLTQQRLINALAAEIDERAAFSEGTELFYRTKFRRCYRKAGLSPVMDTKLWTPTWLCSRKAISREPHGPWLRRVHRGSKTVARHQGSVRHSGERQTVA